MLLVADRGIRSWLWRKSMNYSYSCEGDFEEKELTRIVQRIQKVDIWFAPEPAICYVNER